MIHLSKQMEAQMSSDYDKTQISALEEYGVKVLAIAAAAVTVWWLRGHPWFPIAASTAGGLVTVVTYMMTTYNWTLYERQYNVLRSLMYASLIITVAGAWMYFKT